MELISILLEAKRNFGAVSKGSLYEVIDVEEHENYKIFWYRDNDGLLDYIVYPTLTIYGDLFNIYYLI